MSTKKEFGDFQTLAKLAEKVVALVGELYGTPDTTISNALQWRLQYGRAIERAGSMAGLLRLK